MRPGPGRARRHPVPRRHGRTDPRTPRPRQRPRVASSSRRHRRVLSILRQLQAGRRLRHRRLRQRRRRPGSPAAPPAAARLPARRRSRPRGAHPGTKVADRIAVTVPPAQEMLGYEKTVLTGYPVRDQFFGVDKAEARREAWPRPGLPTLLVSGASSGAARLNQNCVAWAAGLPQDRPAHPPVGACGRGRGCAPASRCCRRTCARRYHLHAYLHDEMPLALAAADLGVMRAGASVLGELPATRLPAILVPGEYEGWDQSPNAQYLEDSGAPSCCARRTSTNFTTSPWS